MRWPRRLALPFLDLPPPSPDLPLPFPALTFHCLALQFRGIPAHIVVPENTPRCKKDAIEGYGARLVLCGNDFGSREAMASQVAEQTGAVPVYPAVGETVMLLHPPPPLVGVSMRMERGCQQNGGLADG